jgi:hypothetical protein
MGFSTGVNVKAISKTALAFFIEKWLQTTSPTETFGKIPLESRSKNKFFLTF